MLSLKTISRKKISNEQILEIKNLFYSSYGVWSTINSPNSNFDFNLRFKPNSEAGRFCRKSCYPRKK